MLKNWIKRTLRSPLPALAAALFTAVLAMVLCGLDRANQKELAEYAHVRKSTPVTLTVTDLTGLKEDGLDLPEWVWRAFTTHSLMPYVKDVHAKMPLTSCYQMTVNGQEVPRMDFVGLTHLELEDSFRNLGGDPVQWFAGYDASVLQSDEKVCILPVGLLPEGAAGGEVAVTFWENGRLYSTVLQVVGTVTTGPEQVYCPFQVMKNASAGLDKITEIDRISATVADNDLLPQVREQAKDWFVEPDLTGTQVPWDYTWYSYYPFALKIDDSQLRTAEETLQSSMLINRVCTVLIFALSAVSGFLVGFLLIRSRKREILLMRTMGTPKRIIYGSYAFEQMFCVVVGALLGGSYFLWQPIERLAAFIGIYCVGLTIALLIFLNTNLLTTMKEDE